MVRDVTGEDAGSEPRTAPYFTDIILGPGDAAKAHQTDEYCSVERIRDATKLYSKLAARWAGTPEYSSR